MGRLHAERLASDTRCRIVSIFDVDSAAVESVWQGVARDAHAFLSFADMLEQTQIDAAIVCSPTQLHFEHVTALLDRRIAVLCEKPLARTRQEINTLITTASQTGTVLAVAYQRRLLAIYRTMRRLVQSGELGPVRAVLSHNIENWQQNIAGTWRDDPQFNFGGFIGDAGSHKIDAAFYVTGLAPTEVFARCDNCGSRVETTASVSALLTGGIPLTMNFVGNAQYFSEMLSVHCAAADLAVRDGELWIARGGRAERVSLTEADSHPIAAFVDLLFGKAENFAPPECAVPVFELTAGILESSRTGKPIAIGPSV
jgi:predicted dehydrogenase